MKKTFYTYRRFGLKNLFWKGKVSVMGYPDLMPVSGYSFTPPVIQQQDKSKHHLLGSALLGGVAGYGAYKLNLDIIKDSMSAQAFEDAVRSGKKIEFAQPLTSAERNILNLAQKSTVVLPDFQIGRIFGSKDQLTFYDYLQERYPDGNIKSPQDLERAIAKKEKDIDPEKSSHHADIEKLDNRRPHIESLKADSDELARIEKEISSLSQQERNLAKDSSKNADKLKNVRKNLERQKRRQSDFATKIEKSLKQANITGDTIDKMSKGAYKQVKDLTDSLRVKDIHASQDVIAKRRAFFDSCYETVLAEHNRLLKERPKADSSLLRKKADLELVRAAEAGDGFVTKSMAQEAYQKLGAEAGKGEASIAKAFEALGKKLPKEVGSLKKAGLLGAVVALGIYCFKD